jgi:hypothetical protein
MTYPGLPDGIFEYQKHQYDYIFERLVIDSVRIIYVHLMYFMDFWDIS